MTGLSLSETDPFHPDALAMIAGSAAELSGLYAPEHRFAFSPQQLVDAGVRFLVARRDGVPVGCGGVAPCDGFGELKRMYVVPAWRGSGIATALIDRLEGIAWGMGLHLMRLETGSASPAAIARYTRSGYARRGPIRAYTENESSVFMEKQLCGEKR